MAGLLAEKPHIYTSKCRYHFRQMNHFQFKHYSQLLNGQFNSFFRFCIIGAINLILSILLIMMFVELFHSSYLVATSLNWIITNLIGFILNKQFTFRSFNTRWTKELIRYLFVMASSFLLSLMFMFLMVDIVGLNYLVSAVCMAFIMTVPNYFAHKFWSFIGDKA